ncbi:MAG: sulfite exporter TauE/SafE family protein [Parachlamydiales bacterium]|jgi:hypothetical protein
MTLLLSMLPIYILGNLHCIGMCGPLVMMIGKHNYRNWYFAGRITSFTLIATLAASLGSVLTIFLNQYNLGALLSLLFGIAFISYGILKLFNFSLHIPGPNLGKYIAPLILKDSPKYSFSFGLSTVLLPCGQSLLVFSACALSGDTLTGFINGAAFSLLTTPSLLLAMHAHKLLSFGKKYYNQLLALASIIAGSIALLRSLADLNLIPHLTLSQSLHITIF